MATAPPPADELPRRVLGFAPWRWRRRTKATLCCLLVAAYLLSPGFVTYVSQHTFLAESRFLPVHGLLQLAVAPAAGLAQAAPLLRSLHHEETLLLRDLFRGDAPAPAEPHAH